MHTALFKCTINSFIHTYLTINILVAKMASMGQTNLKSIIIWVQMYKKQMYVFK